MDIKIQNKNSFLSSHILYDLMYTKKKGFSNFSKKLILYCTLSKFIIGFKIIC